MPDLTKQIPSSLEPLARWERLGERGNIPVLLVHPDPDRATPAPPVIWLHGRTVSKELDPGRYLRWARAGIGACAVDLPGHGERFDESLQHASAAWDVLTPMVEEIDLILDSLREQDRFRGFDLGRIAIGGMSLGGMTALARLTREHPFVCAGVEAATGSWAEQRGREMFAGRAREETRKLEPIEQLEEWREIPLQAIHTRGDQWVKFDGQQRFIEALRTRYADPELIEFITYDETGAKYEHVGFGKHAIDAKTRQTEFLTTYLLPNA